MPCFHRWPPTRLCQAAHHAEECVESLFQRELNGSLMTAHRHRMGNFRFQEETITELTLAELQIHYGDCVRIVMFDRQAESDIGADWIWVLENQGRRLPMLVQAKRSAEIWTGEENWSVAVDQGQRQTLEDSANGIGIGAQYCIYGPGWSSRPRCFPFPNLRFMHLIPTLRLTQDRHHHGDSSLQHMVPFTCLCCCTHDVAEAADMLDIIPEKYAQSPGIEDLIGIASESRNIKGIAVFQAGEPE